MNDLQKKTNILEEWDCFWFAKKWFLVISWLYVVNDILIETFDLSWHKNQSNSKTYYNNYIHWHFKYSSIRFSDTYKVLVDWFALLRSQLFPHLLHCELYKHKLLPHVYPPNQWSKFLMLFFFHHSAISYSEMFREIHQ